MALSFATAAMYGLLPAVAGLLAAFALMQPVRTAGAASPELRRLAFALHPLLTTGLMFAFAATVVTGTSTEPGLQMPLLVVGCAAAVVALVQALMARSGFHQVANDRGHFGRLLLRMAFPEPLVIGAFAWVVFKAVGIA